MQPNTNTDVVLESRYRSRKFQLTLGSLLVSTLALFTGFIDGDQFVDIISMILGIYGVGNVAGYYVAAQKGK